MNKPFGSAAAQVVIVDDNVDAAMSLAMLLELEDIDSASVPDAEAALQLVERTTPRLMLIDIGLPGMNGFELARRLREIPNTRHATLIALTGHEIGGGRNNPADGLFDQHWSKPFDPNRLLAQIKAVLEEK